MVAASSGSMYGALYYRHIELNKQHGLKYTKGNYEVYYTVEGKLTKYVPTNHEPPSVTSYSYASNLGWGAHMKDHSTGGLKSSI